MGCKQSLVISWLGNITQHGVGWRRGGGAGKDVPTECSFSGWGYPNLTGSFPGAHDLPLPRCMKTSSHLSGYLKLHRCSQWPIQCCPSPWLREPWFCPGWLAIPALGGPLPRLPYSCATWFWTMRHKLRASGVLESAVFPDLKRQAVQLAGPSCFSWS